MYENNTYDKYCTNCGAQVTNGQNFCVHCGERLQKYGVEPAQGGRCSNEEITLISAYKKFFQNYTNFKGRSRRSEYWYATLAHFIIITVLSLFVMIPIITETINITTFSRVNPSAASVISMIIGCLVLFGYVIATLVPSISLAVRRLHDTGKSGWFLLLNLLGIIPIVGFIGSIVLLVFYVLDSEPGTNQYGPNPKGINRFNDINI